jgi:hypothetical protein
MTVTDPVFEDHVFAPHAATAYGPILSGFEVEYAIATCTRFWIRDYLAEVERQRRLEVGRLPLIRSIVESSEPTKYPEDQLPALLVACGGIEARPARNSEGAYTARFTVDCGAVVSARANRQAVRLARFYTAAIRAMLLQQLPDVRWSGLEGIRRVEYAGEVYQQLGPISDRTQCRGIVQLVVEVENVTNWVMGPNTPSDPPIGVYLNDAETVEVTVIKEPLGGESAATRN